jgi:hypothetical protein
MIFLRWKSHVAAKNDAKADAENGLIRQDDYCTRGAANAMGPLDWTLTLR